MYTRTWLDTAATRAAGIACALALAACGGAGEADPAALIIDPAVKLEGCVVDAGYALRAGRTVQVLAADGRVLATAVSNADGEFTAQVPSGQRLVVRVPGPGGDTLAATAGDEGLWLTSCLRDTSG